MLYGGNRDIDFINYRGLHCLDDALGYDCYGKYSKCSNLIIDFLDKTDMKTLA